MPQIRQAGTRTRDLLGYAGSPPDPHWPGGTRVAVSIVVNFEEGVELSISDGDPENEAVYEIEQRLAGRPDPAIDSHFEYGSRAGWWRIMEVLGQHGTLATVSSSGRAVERLPLLAQDAVRRGHEVSAHGWRWEGHAESDGSEERDRIARTVAAIKAVTGTRPVGWHTRSPGSVNTRRLLVEEGVASSTTATPTTTTCHISCRSETSGTWYCRTRRHQRHAVLPYQPVQRRRRFRRLCDRRLRLVASRRGACPEDDVDRAAPANNRPARPHRCPRQDSSTYHQPRGRLDRAAGRHCQSLVCAISLKEARYVRISDPQSRHGDACDRPPPLERDHGRRRAGGRRRNRRDRHVPGPQPETPECRGGWQRQRSDVAGVCQRSPPYRIDAGAAGLAGHAARIVVRDPHGDAQRRPLPRHALFGVRDGRVGCHDGPASAQPYPRKTRSGGSGLRRGDPSLPGCRDACLILVCGARPEPA